jgi:hypothetical protein
MARLAAGSTRSRLTQSGHRPEVQHLPFGRMLAQRLTVSRVGGHELAALEADDGFATETAVAKLFEHLGDAV